MKTFYRNWVAVLLTLMICACIALLSIFTTGCSVVRKVNKSEIKTQEQQTGLSDTKTQTQDKTVTKVTETTKGEVVVPGVKVESENTGTVTTSQVDGNTITAVYDKGTNTIKTVFTGKPFKVPVSTTKTTEIQANVSKTETAKIDTSSIKKSATVTKQKDSKTSYVWFGIGGVVLLAGISFVAWRYFKTKFI